MFPGPVSRGMGDYTGEVCEHLSKELAEGQVISDSESLEICKEIFNRLDPDTRDRFFRSCEDLYLQGSRIYTVFHGCCSGDYDQFVQAVLSPDESMMKAIKGVDRVAADLFEKRVAELGSDLRLEKASAELQADRWRATSGVREICERICEEKTGGSDSRSLGSLMICLEVSKKLSRDEFNQFARNCEELNLHGVKIYVAFSMFCDRDYDKFIESVLSLDKEMAGKAVQYDLSFVRFWARSGFPDSVYTREICELISEEIRGDPTSPDPNSLAVCLKIFDKLDLRMRDRFFENCEDLHLYGAKIHQAFDRFYERDYDRFIPSVIARDISIIRAVDALY